MSTMQILFLLGTFSSMQNTGKKEKGEGLVRYTERTEQKTKRSNTNDDKGAEEN